MKVISDTAEYALRAVVWLVQTPDESQTTRQIAEGTRTPLDYQSKVLQLLAKSGITKSQRGTGGGIRLNVSPDGLTVLDVINAVDPIQRIHSCPLGLKEHGTCLCPMHRGLNDAVKTVEAAFKNTLVADLLKTRSKSVPLGIDLPLRAPRKPKQASA
ncbi:Rrf2 family transcriptional regulator [Pelagicoccus sp. SDUM812005]|uniref:RrF2 family transcriptional regulator n=1 Tax=Pelagicoccus sp. SDUM812005 TaxID=3041257 RepID=UPI00280F0C5F|nr:Rrf2 family transcriptional regulator [Pelagicoccus sp. SDUM812005]MDQ8182270.1 Rrf2 family transcriptional regulator [Pelagicoccus sp. SDUM812005]